MTATPPQSPSCHPAPARCPRPSTAPNRITTLLVKDVIECRFLMRWRIDGAVGSASRPNASRDKRLDCPRRLPLRMSHNRLDHLHAVRQLHERMSMHFRNGTRQHSHGQSGAALRSVRGVRGARVPSLLATGQRSALHSRTAPWRCDRLLACTGCGSTRRAACYWIRRRIGTR